MDFYEQQLGFTMIEGKKFRRGITTGTCATAAAEGAALFLLTGEAEASVDVNLPNGQKIKVLIHSYEKSDEGGSVSAYVEKFAGDDIDVTNKMLVGAKVEILNGLPGIILQGGKGVGIVSRPGLQVEVGEAAINPVPRKMIEENLITILQNQKLKVTIIIPNGEEAAKKTFNPRIGIKNGISVLGTTGIVEPMSEEGYKKSLLAELDVKKNAFLALTPGNYGEKFLNALGIDSSKICITSNFIGYMLREGASRGTKGFLIAGHVGKLIKLAGGIFNTHSHVADGKNHILTAQLAIKGAPLLQLQEAMEANTMDQAVHMISTWKLDSVWQDIAEVAATKSRLHVYDQCEIEVMMFDIQGNLLGQSRGAQEMLERISQDV